MATLMAGQSQAMAQSAQTAQVAQASQKPALQSSQQSIMQPAQQPIQQPASQSQPVTPYVLQPGQNPVPSPLPAEEFRKMQPNLGKVFIKNLLLIFFTMLALVLIVAFINAQIGLGTLTDILQALDISVNGPALFVDIAIFLVILGGIMLIGNYLSEKNTCYEIYKNRLVIRQSVMLVFVSSKEIRFNNIVKVSYERIGLIDKMLDAGTIRLELTGMKDSAVKIGFIDESSSMVEYLQNLIREFNAAEQYRYIQSRNMAQIIDKVNI